MKIITQFLVVLVVFFGIDIVWLGLIAKNMYAKYLGYLMAPTVNWLAAIIFYLLFIVGLMIFVLLPALDKGSITHALLYGALFGLMTYATYDLTNLATIKDWPLNITIIDLIWGTTLSASVSTVSYWIITTFLK